MMSLRRALLYTTGVPPQACANIIYCPVVECRSYNGHAYYTVRIIAETNPGMLIAAKIEDMSPEERRLLVKHRKVKLSTYSDEGSSARDRPLKQDFVSSVPLALLRASNAPIDKQIIDLERQGIDTDKVAEISIPCSSVMALRRVINQAIGCSVGVHEFMKNMDASRPDPVINLENTIILLETATAFGSNSIAAYYAKRVEFAISHHPESHDSGSRVEQLEALVGDPVDSEIRRMVSRDIADDLVRLRCRGLLHDREMEDLEKLRATNDQFQAVTDEAARAMDISWDSLEQYCASSSGSS